MLLQRAATPVSWCAQHRHGFTYRGGASKCRGGACERLLKGEAEQSVLLDWLRHIADHLVHFEMQLEVRWVVLRRSIVSRGVEIC